MLRRQKPLVKGWQLGRVKPDWRRQWPKPGKHFHVSEKLLNSYMDSWRSLHDKKGKGWYNKLGRLRKD